MAYPAEKNIKERSPLYPVFTVNEIVDFVNEIVNIGGKRISIKTVADTLGVSEKTNSFRSKISTAKQFGLLKGSNGVVELTELSKRIVYPVNELDTKKAMLESFLSAPLYNKLVEKYENKGLPDQDKLSNILLLEYGLTKSAKDIAAAKFIESAEQVGVLKNGVIVLNSDNEEVDYKVIRENVTSLDENIDNKSSADKLEYCFTIPTLSGASAKVVIPREVTEKDLDFITLYIQNMLPTFISNLKEELDK